MKQVKFVGGPFNGEIYEVNDDIVEMRLPILKDNMGNVDYLKYVKPNEGEFVFASKEIGKSNYKPVVATPDIVETGGYSFKLVKLEKGEARGAPREPDWCDYHIIVTNRWKDSNEKWILKIWSMQGDREIEFVDIKKFEFSPYFFYGLGKLLEQNNFVN